MPVEFKNRVAIVTGAGGGLGRSHAIELARRGVKVVVNDLGGDVRGEGGSMAMADQVVAEIEALGGEAVADGANVTRAGEVRAMVDTAISKWGKVDILVNNAGILRDRSFSKMEMSDFRLVTDVHMIGTAVCTRAVWNHMRENRFGRIVVTTSSSGMYGNFGQANYSAAKAGVVGFMNTLCLEGAKYDIRVNALSPIAGTRMTKGLFPEEALDLFPVESVSAGLVYLVCDDAPNRTILCAGGGSYAATRIYETNGIYLLPQDRTAENVAGHWDAILDPAGQGEHDSSGHQSMKFAAGAQNHMAPKNK